MDGWMDGWTDGKTDGQTERKTDNCILEQLVFLVSIFVKILNVLLHISIPLINDWVMSVFFAFVWYTYG